MPRRNTGKRVVIMTVVAGAIAAVAGVMIFGASVVRAAPPAVPCPAGETISVTAPTASAPTTVSVAVAPPVNLRPAKDAVPDSFHLHYFVDIDPSTVVQAGQPVPTGNPKIIHSGTTTQDVGALGPGKHTVWVVLGDVTHTICDPMVAGSASFEIAASALPAGGMGATARASRGELTIFIAALVAGLAAASGGLVVRRF
jgi:hypothetical protein